MGLLDRIFGTRLSTADNPQAWFLKEFGGGKTSSGERINEQTALTCVAVKAAVSLLSETIGRLPLSVHRHLPGGGSVPAPEAREHKLLHDEPNDNTSSFIFRETLQGHLGTYGNAYAEI